MNITLSSRPLRSHLRIWLSRLAVRQKIACGYVAILAIVILGVILGRAIEINYRRNAQTGFEKADQRVLEIKEIQNDLLEMQLHAQNLAGALQQSPDDFEQEFNHIQDHLLVLESWLNNTTTGDRAAILGEFYDAIEKYKRNLNAIAQQIINSPPQTPAELQTTQQELANFTTSAVAYDLGSLTHDLDRLVLRLKQDREQAILGLEQAERIGSALVVASLVLAIGVAAMLLLYISNAIARPLQEATQVTRKVTQNADFTLQAPVTTEDEIGELTTALNQLIRSIHDYLQKLKSTQAQLIQTEKMSSLGQMVAGIAHEINNPVSFIYGNIAHAEENIKDLLYLVTLYQQEYPNPSDIIAEEIEAIDLEFLAQDLPKILGSMKLGTERIREIILSLRNFSRTDDSALKKINLHAGIDSTLIILNNRLKKEIKVHKNYSDLPEIECYPAQLNQVWMNLISNAIDTLEEAKARDNRFNAEILIQTEPLENNRVLVTIRDNGAGISTAAQAKIFDAFFTTKPIGKGTGLGLSICASIIEKHHGTIQLCSQPNQGTAFAIALPILQPKPLVSTATETA